MDQKVPDYKTLKQLAKACRKAGIKEFEGFGFRFSLTEIDPEAKKLKTKKVAAESSDNSEIIQSDSLTEEQLMFYSTGLPGFIGSEN